MTKVKKILLASLFLASTIVISRLLSIRTSIVTIGFSFVPIILCAILLDLKYTLFVTTLSDIIGSLLFPTGAYFYGFTITAFLTGLTYSLFLYNKNGFKFNKKFIIRLVISILIVSLVLNGVLNTIWIYVITKGATKLIVPIRVVKEILSSVIKIVTMTTICKLFEERLNSIYDKNS